MGAEDRRIRTGAAWTVGSGVAKGLVVVLLSPLLLPLMLAYGVYAILLHLLLWLLWSPAGTRVLFVYSNSPVWRPYIEEHILPMLPQGSVVLNWSERRRWRWWSLSAAAEAEFLTYLRLPPRDPTI
jgi:hypothetical protein